MTPKQKIAVRLSQVRERLNEIGQLEGDDYSDEVRTEETTLQTEYGDLERRHRSAIISENGQEETRQVDADAEQRERVELRSKASLTAYLRAALAGRRVDGAEAELQAAAGIGDGIPLELWDVLQPVEQRADAATGAPGTVGVNLDRLRPAVFANSIAPRLGIEMPRVESGTYASGTVTTSLTSGSKAKGDAAESTAAAFTVTSVTPKRISARLGIRIEDVAAVGQGNFESALRENLALALSDELDDQAINGGGGNSGADLNGILAALTAPADPTAVADFNAFASAHAGGVDGLWANTIKGRFNRRRRGDLPARVAHLPERHQLPGRVVGRCLRDGEHRRILDQQADARRGLRHPAGDSLSQGAVDDGRRRGDADGGLPALERDRY